MAEVTLQRNKGQAGQGEVAGERLTRRGFGALLTGAGLQADSGVWNEVEHACPYFLPDGRLERFTAISRQREENLGGGVTLRMASIPGGTFQMGSTIFNTGSLTATPLPIRTVQVKGFELGVFAVTRGQWRRVGQMPRIRQNLFPFSPGTESLDDRPVEAVLFELAEEFLARLRAFTGRPYRLPSEAEWEYACRAGTTTLYHFGDRITREVANFGDGPVPPGGRGVLPVGSLRAPNRFGVEEMHGQVTEWCADYLNPTYDGAPTDGSAWLRGDGSKRMFRGGWYLTNASTCRSAERAYFDRCCGFAGLGFRVALDGTDENSGDPSRKPEVVHAARGTAGPICPGQIITAYGDFRLTAEEAATAAEGLFPRQMRRGRMMIGGIASPLLYAGPRQVNAVVPYAVKPGEEAEVYWVVNGQSSPVGRVRVAETAPELFWFRDKQAAALHRNGDLVSADNPAVPGEVVSLFGTGAGSLTEGIVDGAITGSEPGRFLAPARCEVGGSPAELRYFGPAPGLVSGLFQANVQVPDGLSTGFKDVRIHVGGRPSEGEVRIAISSGA